MTVAAVARCPDVLECFAGAVGALELGDIAARGDAPKSGVHRIPRAGPGDKAAHNPAQAIEAGA